MDFDLDEIQSWSTEQGHPVGLHGTNTLEPSSFGLEDSSSSRIMYVKLKTTLGGWTSEPC